MKVTQFIYYIMFYQVLIGLAGGGKRARADGAAIPMILIRPTAQHGDIPEVVNALAVDGITVESLTETMRIPDLQVIILNNNTLYNCLFFLNRLTFDFQALSNLVASHSGGNTDSHIRAYMMFQKQFKELQESIVPNLGMLGTIHSPNT